MTFAANSPAAAEGRLVPISGAGSTWSQIAIDQWKGNVAQYGLRVNYAGTGSTDGRVQFGNGTADYGVSEIPYGIPDQGAPDPAPPRKFAYMPVVAGGTAFMYNLKIGGKRVTNLRLSGDVIAKIFTSNITHWNDPAIVADNPGLGLPARQIIPVVRSDGSGTTAQLTTWFATEHRGVWDAYCVKAGRSAPCGVTSFYPVVAGTGMTALAQSSGVSGYVGQDQNEGTITYVEYSYALDANFPVAKMLNRAGFYIEPTEFSVAVALLEARINGDETSTAYLTQELSGVYGAGDARAYPLSSYSYMIIPTKLENGFSEDKGYTLGKFAYYFLCEGQQQAPDLGYSPLPINLVKAGLEQVAKIPGVDPQGIDIAKCNNPTFSPDGTNKLAAIAPQPPTCDAKGPEQCTTGTGGLQNVVTAPSTSEADGDGQDADEPAAEGEAGPAAPPVAAGPDPAPGQNADNGQPVATDPGSPGVGTSTQPAPKGGTKAAPGVVAATPGANAAPKAAQGSDPSGANSGVGQPISPSGDDGNSDTGNGNTGSGNAGSNGTGGATPQSGAKPRTGPGGATAAASADKQAKAIVLDPDVEPIEGSSDTELPGASADGEQVIAVPGGGDTAGGQSAGRTISAVPVSLTTATTSGFRVTLMALAALLLIAVVVAPPVVARKLNDRNAA